MKRLAILCLWILSGCATVSASRSDTRAPRVALEESAGPVRLETPAGTFLVNPNNAEDFGRLLAGKPTPYPYYSVTDMP